MCYLSKYEMKSTTRNKHCCCIRLVQNTIQETSDLVSEDFGYLLLLSPEGVTGVVSWKLYTSCQDAKLEGRKSSKTLCGKSCDKHFRAVAAPVFRAVGKCLECLQPQKNLCLCHIFHGGGREGVYRGGAAHLGWKSGPCGPGEERHKKGADSEKSQAALQRNESTAIQFQWAEGIPRPRV